MALVQMDVPLADVLIETGIGIRAMNYALGENNVGATSASVKIRFVASFVEGNSFSSHNYSSKGAKLRFLFFGGASTKHQRTTDYYSYRRLSEHIFIDVSVNFETLPDVDEGSGGGT